MPTADVRIIKGQGGAVPLKVVVILSGALDRDIAAIIRLGVGGGIRTAGQRHAAYMDRLTIRRPRRGGQQGERHAQAEQDRGQSFYPHVFFSSLRLCIPGSVISHLSL